MIDNLPNSPLIIADDMDALQYKLGTRITIMMIIIVMHQLILVAVQIAIYAYTVGLNVILGIIFLVGWYRYVKQGKSTLQQYLKYMRLMKI